MHRYTYLKMRPIGVIRTRFTEQEGTPIQGCMAQDEIATIEVHEEFMEGLAGLEGFSHLWLLYCFNQARGWSPKVKPYLDTVEHGIFATRSPCRPNPIGMTCVRLLRAEGKFLTVAGADMLDGTPLLDIKPCVPAFDHHPVETIGWFRGKLPEGKVLADRRFE
ncbi:MAG TPA: tRNA (N6-threonylcarbamoyladenosine(37)-N6)-methyltransferase TrmO [Chroococcales cyanobacterium]|jgi:tRNA-Thr(GGU) m(6)t(6)A37 methyltransferase TsaA